MSQISQKRLDQQASVLPDGPLELALIDLLRQLGFHAKRIAALYDMNQGRVTDAMKGKFGRVPAWYLVIDGITDIEGGGSNYEQGD